MKNEEKSKKKQQYSMKNAYAGITKETYQKIKEKHHGENNGVKASACINKHQQHGVAAKIINVISENNGRRAWRHGDISRVLSAALKALAASKR